MGDEGKATISATINRKQKKAMFVRLVQNDLTFSDWLRVRIEEYLSKPKAKRRNAAA